MDRACSMHIKFWLDNLKGRDHVEDLGLILPGVNVMAQATVFDSCRYWEIYIK
jgi:hypothetical protein